MRKKLVFASLFAVPYQVYALVPPDYQEPPSDFTAEIEAGFQLNTGNTESSSFNGRTKFIYDTQKAKQELTFKGYYASNSEEITAEKYQLQLQTNYKIRDGYIFGQGDFTWDKFGSFTRIATVSAGYGFDAIDTSITSLSLEVGPGFRYNLPMEKEPDADPVAKEEIILRTSAKFEQKLQEYTSFSADLIGEWGEINSTLALDLAYKNTIFQDWAFKIGFNIKYTQVVPEGTKRTDTVSTFNLIYTFQ